MLQLPAVRILQFMKRLMDQSYAMHFLLSSFSSSGSLAWPSAVRLFGSAEHMRLFGPLIVETPKIF